MAKVTMYFRPEIAKELGTDSAIILSNIEFWVYHNQTNNKHLHDGKNWTFNSIKAFQEQFHWLSVQNIRTCLKKLEEAGYIEVGNYNQHKYDQTKWYSLGKQFHLLESTNAIDKTNKPIPDNKPDNKPYNSKAEIVKTYNEVFNRKISLDKPTEKNIDYWLKVYSLEEIKQAIIRAKYFKHNWWVYRNNKSNEPNLSMLFRQKNTKQEKVDYIGELLNLQKPTGDEAFFMEGLTGRLLQAGVFDLKGGESNG
jgi:hypothetical protein